MRSSVWWKGKRVAVATEILKPPITQIGYLGWLKKNLFSNWFNSILTIVALWIIYRLVALLFSFVAGANWNVIIVNLRLFVVGRYPLDQIWRVQSSLWITSFLLGASWRLWGGILRMVGLALGVVFMLAGLAQFGTTNADLSLGANVLWLAIGFGFAYLARSRGLILGLWLGSPFVIGYLLNGGGPLVYVPTDLWGGLLLTFVLSVFGILLSFPLGVLLALGRQSSYPVIRWFCIAFIELVRGVPLVTLIFAAQIVFPIFLPEGITVERVTRALAAFVIFAAAYLAEVVRGGLQSVGQGQSEAARAIGLNTIQLLWLVILPQALRNVIPAIVGQFISLFKDTSLVAIVGLLDLAGIANAVISQQEFLGRQSEVLVFIAAIYFICCFVMTYASRRLEVRLGVGER